MDCGKATTSGAAAVGHSSTFLAGARIGRDCNVCDRAFVENGGSATVSPLIQVMIFEGPSRR
jgi:hypothetical protein